MSDLSPAEKKEARRLLASDKKADNAVLLHWLGLLPAATSLDLLAKIAEEAPKRRSWLTPLTALAIITLLFCIISIAMRHSHVTPPFGGLLIFVALEGNRHNVRRMARKAALLLSDRDDHRAIAPLVWLWQVSPARTSAGAKEKEIIEYALTRLLTTLVEKGSNSVGQEAVCDLLERAFPLPRKPRKRSPGEITESGADFLLAALRYLTHSVSWKDSPRTRDLVARIASYPVTGSAPNRSLVCETAVACQSAKYQALPRYGVAMVAETLELRL